MYLQSRIPRGARQPVFPLVNTLDDRYELLKAVLSLFLLLRRKLWVEVLDSHRIFVFVWWLHGC